MPSDTVETRVVHGALFAIMLSGMLSIGTGASAATARPPAVGRVAKDFTLTELNGGPTTLSRFTKAGPVVLVVLRGFPGYQCPYCTRQFGEFLGAADEFEKSGATVLFVYPGPAEDLKTHAEEFVRGKDHPGHFRILLDPDYAFTDAYGLRWNAENETSYPSTFVIDRKRKVIYAKVSRAHGDRARVEDVLKALTDR